MKVLIDTNVFITREGNRALPEELQKLENLLKTEGHDILIHPLSKQEIRNYENEKGRRRDESKIETYAQLTYPPYPNSSDSEFRNFINEAGDFNEKVDNALLYSVYQNRIDVLITEDGGIQHKARELGIDDRVLSIEEGREYFQHEEQEYGGPPSIQKTTVGELDIDEPIFDSLKEEYGFIEWFEGIPERSAYVNWNPDGSLGAVLILKPNEAEQIGDRPPLEKKDRMKVCTLKVAEERRGSKTGELLIDIAVREAIQHGLEEIYLTHRIRSDDHLVKLISAYGFKQASKQKNGESVFVKRLTPGLEDDPDPVETHIRFYPSFYDGAEIRKFLVPIKPVFHGRLFTNYDKRHPRLTEFGGKFLSEGNAIKKAYLTNANTRKIGQADVLLFYRSHDHNEVTSLGVCERVEYGVTTVEEIRNIVGRRSVFTEAELRELVEDSDVTVLLFKHHFDLNNPIHYHELLNEKVLKGPPQTTLELDEEGYEYIKETGGIDERFIIH